MPCGASFPAGNCARTACCGVRWLCSYSSPSRRPCSICQFQLASSQCCRQPPPQGHMLGASLAGPAAPQQPATQLAHRQLPPGAAPAAATSSNWWRRQRQRRHVPAMAGDTCAPACCSYVLHFSSGICLRLSYPGHAPIQQDCPPSRYCLQPGRQCTGGGGHPRLGRSRQLGNRRVCHPSRL